MIQEIFRPENLGPVGRLLLTDGLCTLESISDALSTGVTRELMVFYSLFVVILDLHCTRTRQV